MFSEIHIENFKSIERLALELGRVTVLIGENGCGKTNILEAIGLGAAAAANKLDNEFLISRGIRVSDPLLMRSGFTDTVLNKPVIVIFRDNADIGFIAQLQNDNKPYSQWTNVFSEKVRDLILEIAKAGEASEEFIASLEPDMSMRLLLAEFAQKMQEELRPGAPEHTTTKHRRQRDLRRVWARLLSTEPDLVNELLSQAQSALGRFLAYSPQINTLRELDIESHIEPLGIYGEGLFRLLRTLQAAGRLNEVRENLRMIDWFENIEPLEGAKRGTPAVRIRDHYMDPSVPSLDQNSSNEGFLFLLFYTCLFMSSDTPAFFAVDNVESALNPKLCTRLVRTMTELAKKYDKQVILTTHNPAALDGLNLKDDDQRLLVVYRNVEGRTTVRRVPPPDLREGEEPVRLSEAFLRGYIGGLPTNF